MSRAPATATVAWPRTWNGSSTRAEGLEDRALGAQRTRGPATGLDGAHLAERYGNAQVVVGFASHAGRYTAIQPGLGLVSDNEMTPSAPGSLEWRLHETSLPRLVLDLRGASSDAPESSWLRRTHEMRSIGTVAMDRQFFPIVAPDAYDVLIYFDQTHASASFRARGMTDR